MSEEKKSNQAGILIALAAAGLLLAVFLFRSGTNANVPAEQSSMATALVAQMMTNGVLVNYDCPQNTAWVNRAVWEKYNAEQQRNMTIGLATVCNARGSGYRIAIVDFDTKHALTKFP